jgi:hypothetical protein
MPTTPVAGAPGRVLVLPRPGGVLSWALRHATSAVVVVGLGVAWETFAPSDYKISTLTGGFLGHEKAVATATELEVIRATAEANAQGAVRAQQQIAAFQAQNERLTRACEALYAQNSAMTQSINAMNERYFAARQDVIAQSQKLKSDWAQFADAVQLLGPILGFPKIGDLARQLAADFRHQAMDDMDSSMQDGLNTAMSNTRNYHPGNGNMSQLNADIVASCGAHPDMAPAYTSPRPPARYDQQPLKKS